MNRELKLEILFWDTKDPKTIERYSAEEAYKENLIVFKGDILVPTDECSIIRRFTGLKDSKGKEIYEADKIKGVLITNRDVPISGEVVYDIEHSAWAIKNQAGLTFLMRIMRLEVIGNSFENT